MLSFNACLILRAKTAFIFVHILHNTEMIGNCIYWCMDVCETTRLIVNSQVCKPTKNLQEKQFIFYSRQCICNIAYSDTWTYESYEKSMNPALGKTCYRFWWGVFGLPEQIIAISIHFDGERWFDIGVIWAKRSGNKLNSKVKVSLYIFLFFRHLAVIFENEHFALHWSLCLCLTYTHIGLLRKDNRKRLPTFSPTF